MLLEHTEEGWGQPLMEAGEQLDVMLGRPFLRGGSYLDGQHLQTKSRSGLYIPLE